MPSRKDKNPVPKRDDARTGGAKPSDSRTKAASKRDDLVAVHKAHREFMADLDSVDAWRELSTAQPVLRVEVRRPDDLFVADISLLNLRIVAGSSPTLKRINTGEEALMSSNFHHRVLASRPISRPQHPKSKTKTIKISSTRNSTESQVTTTRTWPKKGLGIQLHCPAPPRFASPVRHASRS